MEVTSKKFIEMAKSGKILPDNLTVGGWLDLIGTSITSLPDNLTVGGWLDLSGTGITSLPDNLTVGGWLDLIGTSITSLPDNLTVGGSLDLRGTGITSLPDNLTVGGWLDLSGTGITSLPDNLTVGGWLDLSGTGITSLPDNLTVGGWLDLSGTGIAKKERDKVKELPPIHINNIRGLVLCDGVLTRLVKKRKNVIITKHLTKNETVYIVTDGNGRYSHGSTIKEAKESLVYKIKDRDCSKFENFTIDSILSFAECVEAYRTITGACEFATKDFVTRKIGTPKSKYKISQIIEMTKGEYGSEEFAMFFKKKPL